MAEQAPGPSSSSGLSQVEGVIEPPLFTVHPLPECPHLGQVTAVPETGIDARVQCQRCENVGENWICLSCHQVNCGRHVQEHAVHHFIETEHAMALSLADLSVWCYVCDSYVHNAVLTPAKRSAHISKFGCDIGED